METRGKGPRGPLRLAVGEQIVRGRIHQVLACGHTVEAVLDKDGLWAHDAKTCVRCLHREPLTEEEIRAAIRSGDWGLTEPEESEWVARAKRVWHYVRYGDEGVRT